MQPSMFLTAIVMVNAVALGAARPDISPSPSVVSTFLDLLPELEGLSGRPGVTVKNAPKVDVDEVNEAMDIFSEFMPFVREIIQNRARQNNDKVPERAYQALDTMERLVPKFMALAVAIINQPEVNPEDEIPLPDFTNQFTPVIRVPEIDIPSLEVKLDRDVIRNVLSETKKIISRFSEDSSQTKATRQNSDETRSPYYITAETTPAPAPRRAPTQQRTYSSRTRAQPARDQATSSEEEAPQPTRRPVQRTTAAPVAIKRAESSEEAPARAAPATGTVPGSSLAFFSLPTRRSYQRVTRRSESDLAARPKNYFYMNTQ